MHTRYDSIFDDLCGCTVRYFVSKQAKKKEKKMEEERTRESQQYYSVQTGPTDYNTDTTKLSLKDNMSEEENSYDTFARENAISIGPDGGGIGPNGVVPSAMTIDEESDESTDYYDYDLPC